MVNNRTLDELIALAIEKGVQWKIDDRMNEEGYYTPVNPSGHCPDHPDVNCRVVNPGYTVEQRVARWEELLAEFTDEKRN